MARVLYGPVMVGTPTPATDDGNALAFASTSLQAFRVRTGGSAETDLQNVAGSPVTSVTPDSSTGAAIFYGPDGYAGMMWLADPATGLRWPVFPNDLPSRIVGSPVTSIKVNDGVPQTGDVVISVADGINGVNGVNGTNGSQWRNGVGVPPTTLGIVNDWYVNTANGDYYQKTAATTWTKRGSFTTVADFPTYATQAAAQAGLAAGEFADGDIIVIGP